nr:DNA (cytosine-5)-methyltransferase CMT3-like [Ipomoea batatas]
MQLSAHSSSIICFIVCDSRATVSVTSKTSLSELFRVTFLVSPASEDDIVSLAPLDRAENEELNGTIYRAKDTVIKGCDEFVDKQRVFFSEVKDENTIDCLVDKVNIHRIPSNDSSNSRDSIKADCDLYCDTMYLIPCSTFLNLPPGANSCGVNLVTKWAVDLNQYACESLRLNHPETNVTLSLLPLVTLDKAMQLSAHSSSIICFIVCDSRATVSVTSKTSPSELFRVIFLVSPASEDDIVSLAALDRAENEEESRLVNGYVKLELLKGEFVTPRMILDSFSVVELAILTLRVPGLGVDSVAGGECRCKVSRRVWAWIAEAALIVGQVERSSDLWLN